MVWICICMICCPINVLWYGYAYVWYDAPLMYYGMYMHMYDMICSINVLWYGYAYVWYDAPLMYYGMDMHMYDMLPH